MLHLCSGKNKEGYWHALFKSFEVGSVPAKGSLSKLRQKISYLFFADHLRDLLSSFKRPKWRGLHLYASDGFEVAIPRTEDILNNEYRGRRMKSRGKLGESYYPHLYMVHTYDVLSRTTKALCFGPGSNEIKGALENLQSLEKNSLTIYDRFFSNQKVMKAHFDHGSHFLIRCRRDKFGVPKEIKEFFHSKKKFDSFCLNGNDDHRVYLIKIKDRKKKEPWVLATSKKDLGQKATQDLYRMRWEVETSFADLMESLKLEQWHSKHINGIAQEIYVRFWIMNFAKIHQFSIEKLPKNPMSKIYLRSNYKLVLDFIIDHWDEFFRKSRKVLQKLKIIILKSTERRKRYSRSYKRQIRFNPSNHTAANTIFDAVEGSEAIMP